MSGQTLDLKTKGLVAADAEVLAKVHVSTGGSGQVHSESVKNAEEERLAALAAAAKKAAEPAKKYTIPYQTIPYHTMSTPYDHRHTCMF